MLTFYGNLDISAAFLTFSTGYFLSAASVGFYKLHAEVALNVDGKYVSVTADGAIPVKIQKKFDQAAQMAAKLKAV